MIRTAFAKARRDFCKNRRMVERRASLGPVCWAFLPSNARHSGWTWTFAAPTHGLPLCVPDSFVPSLITSSIFPRTPEESWLPAQMTWSGALPVRRMVRQQRGHMFARTI
jgi:hypothetical protein